MIHTHINKLGGMATSNPWINLEGTIGTLSTLLAFMAFISSFSRFHTFKIIMNAETPIMKHTHRNKLNEVPSLTLLFTILALLLFNSAFPEASHYIRSIARVVPDSRINSTSPQFNCTLRTECEAGNCLHSGLSLLWGRMGGGLSTPECAFAQHRRPRHEQILTKLI